MFGNKKRQGFWILIGPDSHIYGSVIADSIVGEVDAVHSYFTPRELDRRRQRKEGYGVSFVRELSKPAIECLAGKCSHNG